MLLPRCAALQAEDLLNNSAAGGAQPTGEVVAVLARAAGEIVAAIAEEDERALEAKGDTGRQVGWGLWAAGGPVGRMGTDGAIRGCAVCPAVQPTWPSPETEPRPTPPAHTYTHSHTHTHTTPRLSPQEAVLCIPLDRRLPKVRLRSRQLHRLLGCRLVVRIDGWERGSNYPHGHLLRVLGPVNDLT